MFTRNASLKKHTRREGTIASLLYSSVYDSYNQMRKTHKPTLVRSSDSPCSPPTFDTVQQDLLLQAVSDGLEVDSKADLRSWKPGLGGCETTP